MAEDKWIDRFDYKRDQQRVRDKRKKEERMATDGVFDKYTTDNINKLRNKGIIEEFVGIISAGKEANVYYGIGENNQAIAVKIFKIDPQNTKWMKNYIIGDPRFKKIGTSTHKIIYTWSRKEFKNLKQLHRHQIPVPVPLFCVDNIVVMDFIGEENGSPAPRLKDTPTMDDPVQIYEKIVSYIRDMFLEAHLVHGDLSEYNILMWHGDPIIIDVGQAVSTYHINAPSLLMRDIRNVYNFFANYISPEEIGDPAEIYKEILHEFHNA